MKNTLLLTAVIAVGALAQARADSSLPPRAQALFPRMAGHEQAAVTGPGSTVNSTYAGTAARTEPNKSAMGSRAADPDLISRPAYTGRWPFNAGQQRFEVAPLKQGGKECDTNCTKPCCEKK